jgi:hypothetical protein
VATGGVQVHSAYFFPDGRHILETGSMSGEHGLRLWVQDSEGGAPRPISPEGVRVRYRGCISPDGKRVATLDPERKPILYPVDGGAAEAIPGTLDGDEPVKWTADGKSVLVGRPELPNRVFLIDLASGQRKLLKTFASPDPTGLIDNSPPNFSRDLSSYVYSYTRISSDLYVVEGLR